ncbi:MAG TPA: hypothetical protein VF363_10135 [Candidatus Eisenbacteria bacterium]
MRHPRFPEILLVVSIAAALTGCAQRAERLVGNERLIRGAGGLGSTLRAYGPLDRDTYVAADTADRGNTLIVGVEGAFEARVLMRAGRIVLPDTNDVSVSIDSMFLDMQFDGGIDIPSTTLQLSSASAAYDSMNVTWPGPGLGAVMGQSDPSGQIGTYKIGLGNAAAFGFFKAWANDSTLVPALVLRGLNPGVAGFRAGTGRIRIAYHHLVSGVSAPDTVNTPIASDLFIHSPLSPAPTGTDATLILGGRYEPGLALHFPVGTFSEGFSINEARVVLRIDTATMQFFGTHDSVNVEVHRIGNAWPEGVFDARDLGADQAALGVVANFRVRASSDSLLIVPVPTALVREWSATPSSNNGILLRIGESFRWPELHVFSRESSRPPELWVSTTSPPPGRF